MWEIPRRSAVCEILTLCLFPILMCSLTFSRMLFFNHVWMLKNIDMYLINCPMNLWLTFWFLNSFPTGYHKRLTYQVVLCLFALCFSKDVVRPCEFVWSNDRSLSVPDWVSQLGVFREVSDLRFYFQAAVLALPIYGCCKAALTLVPEHRASEVERSSVCPGSACCVFLKSNCFVANTALPAN